LKKPLLSTLFFRETSRPWVKIASASSDIEVASGRADALLNLMGLTPFADAHPNQLSGGMQQRLAIARALMSRPETLLMDEPFGTLDAQTREVMHDLIRHIHRLERSTILFVTHDVDEAIYLWGGWCLWHLDLGA